MEICFIEILFFCYFLKFLCWKKKLAFLLSPKQLFHRNHPTNDGLTSRSPLSSTFFPSPPTKSKQTRTRSNPKPRSSAPTTTNEHDQTSIVPFALLRSHPVDFSASLACARIGRYFGRGSLRQSKFGVFRCLKRGAFFGTWKFTLEKLVECEELWEAVWKNWRKFNDVKVLQLDAERLNWVIVWRISVESTIEPENYPEKDAKLRCSAGAGKVHPREGIKYWNKKNE